LETKKVKLTTDKFEKSRYAKSAPITVQCPYCAKKFHIVMDIETAENKKRLAVTWKCPECNNHSKLWDCRLHRLEE